MVSQRLEISALNQTASILEGAGVVVFEHRTLVVSAGIHEHRL
jgi:hypothetical protein